MPDPFLLSGPNNYFAKKVSVVFLISDVNAKCTYCDNVWYQYVLIICSLYAKGPCSHVYTIPE